MFTIILKLILKVNVETCKQIEGNSWKWSLQIIKVQSPIKLNLFSKLRFIFIFSLSHVRPLYSIFALLDHKIAPKGANSPTLEITGLKVQTLVELSGIVLNFVFFIYFKIYWFQDIPNRYQITSKNCSRALKQYTEM